MPFQSRSSVRCVCCHHHHHRHHVSIILIDTQFLYSRAAHSQSYRQLQTTHEPNANNSIRCCERAREHFKHGLSTSSVQQSLVICAPIECINQYLKDVNRQTRSTVFFAPKRKLKNNNNKKQKQTKNAHPFAYVANLSFYNCCDNY